MDNNRNGFSRSKAGKAKGETSATEARLDEILNPQSTRPGGPSGSFLPSRLDPRSRIGSSSGRFSSPQENVTSQSGLLPRSQVPYRESQSSGFDNSRRYNALSRFGQPSQHQNPSLRNLMPSNLDKPDPGNYNLRNPLLNLLGNSRPLRPTEPSSGPTGAQSGSQVRPATKTAFTNPHDIAMASRQTQYESLSPLDQKKQEEWAQEKIQNLGPCPAGYQWLRVRGGYNCAPGGHWTSDELVAEGKGGFCMLLQSRFFNGLAQEREVGFSDGLERFSPVFYSLVEATEWELRRSGFFGFY